MRNQINDTLLYNKENLHQKGSHYEKIAGAYLSRHGYQIIEYNFRCKYAEIDIVALDKNVLVFCEVKYRKGTDQGRPFEAVHLEKQKRISMAALYYITIHNVQKLDYRFDVIGITDDAIRLIKNAFDYLGG